jgi:hypothetical protein
MLCYRFGVVHWIRLDARASVILPCVSSCGNTEMILPSTRSKPNDSILPMVAGSHDATSATPQWPGPRMRRRRSEREWWGVWMTKVGVELNG